MFESGRFRCGSFQNRVNDLFNLLTIHVIRCFERFISIFRLIQIFKYCNIHFGCQRELFLPTNIRRHWHPSQKNLDSFMTFIAPFFLLLLFYDFSFIGYKLWDFNWRIWKTDADIRNFFPLLAAQLSEVNITIHRLLKSDGDRQRMEERKRQRKLHFIYYPQLNSLKIQSSINRSFNDEAQLSHHLPIGESARATICFFFCTHCRFHWRFSVIFLEEKSQPNQ